MTAEDVLTGSQMLHLAQLHVGDSEGLTDEIWDIVSAHVMEHHAPVTCRKMILLIEAGGTRAK